MRYFYAASMEVEIEEGHHENGANFRGY